MSFSGSGGQIKYTITVEDAQAASALKSTGQQFKELGASTQSATQQMQALPQTYQTIVQEGNKVTSTTKQIQQTMQGTVTTVTTATKSQQSFGQVLKDNVLAIGVAASSIVGLISQYTSLRKAQIVAEKAATAEVTAKNRVIDLTNKLIATTAKYGAGSTQAAKGARDLAAAQEKAATAAQRNDVIQEQLAEKMADFAINILPNVIGSVTGVVQVLQNLSKGAKVSTVTTIENTGAQVANAAAMKLSGGAAAGMVGPLEGVAAAEIGAGTAAKSMGTSIRTALVRTGIGAILVALGTALVAFTQNWYGFRDAVNAAGVQLGKFMPILIPILNGLKFFGEILNKIFGTDIPDAAGEAGGAMKAGMEMGTDAAKEAAEAAKKVADSWQSIQEPFLKLIGDSKWKELKKQIKELGFSGDAAKKIKVGLDVTFEAKDIMKNLQTSLSFISEFHLNAKDTKQWAKNTIGDMKDAIKEHPELKGLLQPIIDVIKANKNDPQGMAGAIADLLTQNPQISAALKKMGIELEPEVVKIGNDWGTSIGKGLSSALAFGLDPKTAGTFQKGLDAWMGKTTETPGSAQGTSFATNFVNSFKAGITSIGGTLDTAITNVFKGFDIIAQLAGIKNAAMFTQGWQSFKDAAGAFGQWITDGWAQISPTIEAIGKGAAGFFAAGWETAIEISNAFSGWITKIWTEISPTVEAIGKGAAGFFGAGWETTVEAASAFSGWITKTWTEISPTITAIGKGAAGFFSDGWKSLTTFGADVGKWISDAIGAGSDAWGKFLQLGKDVAGQILAGIKSVPILGDIVNVVSGGISALQGKAVKDTTTPKKPTTGGTPVIPKPDNDFWAKIWKGLMDFGKPQMAEGATVGAGKGFAAGASAGASARAGGGVNIGGGIGTTPTLKAMPVIDQTAYQKGLQVAINNAAQSIQIITQTITKLASVKLPVIDQTTYQKGLQLAINNANQTFQLISQTIAKIAGIKMPTPNESTYQKGLQLAINNAGQTVSIIKSTLDKISGIKVPAPNEKIYQKGLQLAINNAAQTVKLITKELNKIGSIKVPAPKFNNFNSALDQAVSDTKRAVRDINNALKKINKPGGGGDGKGPGATTGPFAQGGMMIANQRTTATFGEAGPELAMFVPLKGGGQSVGSGRGVGGGGGNIIIENVINIMDETIMRRITARSGRNRYQFGA